VWTNDILNGVLLDLADAEQLYKPGTFFEGSFLFPASLMVDSATSRLRQLKQVQTFATSTWHRLLLTMRTTVGPKLRDKGYPPPSQIQIRVGRSIDDSRPFYKKIPPQKR
jgi:hypothetical protein